ncbi:MAG: hypothetical protein IKX55_06325 [Bacteroidaceae bacterium]|nr:hypothetical protein [Bacteroidaceae bacterium]
MKRFKSLTNRSGLFGAILAVMGTVFGISSCRPDFDLDTRFPEWLGTSVYETLKEGFKNDSTGEFYTFNTFVRLIEDLDQVSVLAKTGSKTLFVADDKAFDRFFQDCPFFDASGNKVTSYDQLSKAQKKMILNGSMLNNVYQVAMLSSSPGSDNTAPQLGTCMRRVSASSILDTIPVVLPENLPQNNKYWDRLRNKSNKGIVLLQDGTNRPMIFFVNKFLQYNRIDNDDYDFLFRLGTKYSKVGKPAHIPGDASVNGVSIAWPNKKCFNGFLHVMSDVVYLLPSMAEYIASNPNTKIYSSILDRFSVPYYEGNERTNRDENIRFLIDKAKAYPQGGPLDQAMTANGDSVYVKKYLSKRTRIENRQQGTYAYQNTNLDGKWTITNEAELLKFDPGWNSFFSSTVESNTDVALQKDMGLMFVPYDDALMQWWLDESQVGARLRARYGLDKYKGRNDLTVDEVIEDMGGVELKTILELVNVNMQPSLVSSVPSKFASVLNDAQDPFFESRTRAEAEATIDDVVMCCNGAVYFTNIVYVPTAYKSVSYPVLVNEKLQIIDWAIKDETLAYRAYLNSMVAEYSFFVPLIDTVNGSQFENKLVWIDPASFYLDKEGGKMKAIAFRYGDANGTGEKVTAELYDYDPATGAFASLNRTIIPGSDDNPAKFIRNRLLDLMDYHIIIGDVEEATAADPNGWSYFRTKGRGTIRFRNTGTQYDYSTMEVQGGWQIEKEGQPDAVQRPVKIVQRVDLSKKTSLTPGNGRTYILDRPLLPSRKSVYDVVSDTLTYPEFTSFFKLMLATSIFDKTSNTNEIGSKYCITSFNTYHYTVYIPKNAGVDKLVKDKVLMLPAELSAINTDFDQKKLVLQVMYNTNPKKDSLVNAAFRDSLLNLSERLFGYRDTAGVDIAMAKKKTGANKETDDEYNYRRDAHYFTNKKLEQLKNFVKYHIQDNSVYVGADFNAGVDDVTGLPATEAKYETAFMNSNQQFVKMTVKGGNSITITDNKPVSAGGPNVRTVQVTNTGSGKPYYNIMCREYEIKPIDTGTTLSEASYASNQFTIETSSYAVVHLIDEPLCNGDVIF